MTVIMLAVTSLVLIKKRQYQVRIEPVRKERPRKEPKREKRRDIANLLKEIPLDKNPSIDSHQQFQFDTRDVFQPLQTDLFQSEEVIDGNGIVSPDAGSPQSKDTTGIRTLSGNYELLGEFLATAYSGAEFNSDGITKTGTNVRLGVVAVDPKVIKLGSVLLVEGYGEAVAEDTGNMILGKHIDVWLPTVQEAKRYGKKTVRVWLNKKREARPPFNN